MSVCVCSSEPDSYELVELPGELMGESVWELRPTEEHTHTLIYLHGFENSGETYSSSGHYFAHPSFARFPGLRVLCPTAPNRRITAWNGRAKRAWYDYLTDHEGEAEDVPAPETLADAVARVHALIRRELQALGDGRRLFVGGNSQGVATALHAVATLPEDAVVGAFVGTAGHVLSCTPVEKLASRVMNGLHFFQAGDDYCMRWSWVSKTFRRLIPVGVQVHMTRYPDIDHHIDEHEGVMIREFLTNYLPAPSMEQQLIAQSDAWLRQLQMDVELENDEDDEEDEEEEEEDDSDDSDDTEKDDKDDKGDG